MTTLFAVAPALPLHAAGKYVAGAYIVFVLIILIYVTIMGVRITRNQRELVELRAELDARAAHEDERDSARPETKTEQVV